MTVTLKIFLFEIQGKMLWLVHCRDSFVWNIMANSLTVTPEIHLFESCILPYYKVQFLNKRLCSMNCGWLKETFWQYVTIHGLDKYNTEMWRESFIRINLTLKFHKDCNFAGQFLIHLNIERQFSLNNTKFH